MGRKLYNVVTMAMGLYAFAVGFVLAISVFMNDNDRSPMTLQASGPVHKALLLVLVAWPFVTMVALGRRSVWPQVSFVLLCLVVATVGVVCAGSDQGALAAFAGTGTSRRTFGMVCLISSVAMLALAGLRMRGLRERI